MCCLLRERTNSTGTALLGYAHWQLVFVEALVPKCWLPGIPERFSAQTTDAHDGPLPDHRVKGRAMD